MNIKNSQQILSVVLRVGFVVVCLVIIGCGGGSGGGSSSSSAETRTVTNPSFIVSANALPGGALTPLRQTVSENDVTSFTISVDPGYRVESITGCAGSVSGNSYTTGQITSACTVTATFALKTYSVTATSSEGGSITPEQTLVTHGDMASFALSNNDGYKVLQVSGCGGSLEGNIFTTVGITNDCSVTAQFTPILYTIGGSTSGLLGTLELLYEFDTGSELLTINANGNYTFLGQAQLNSAYQVSVNTQPADQHCSVTNNVGTVTSDVSNVLVNCESIPAGVSVSGRIDAASLITTDTDVNDLSASFADNSVSSTAQLISHLALLNGFASADPTGGDPSYERFALTADTDDMFKVTLSAGQVIQLQVVDYKSSEGGGHHGDLDLYLYDMSYQLVGASEGIGEFEELLVPSAQDYFINIHAYAGISKYVLRLMPAQSTTTNTSISNSVPDFVPNEMIIKYYDDESGGLTTSKSSPSFKPANNSRRPGLAPVDLGQMRSNRAMAEMKRFNQKGYEKVMTLRSIKKVSQQPDVMYVEPNYIRQSSVAPNDPLYSLQWHYEAIGLPQAWETSTGTSGDQPVIVAVIDTGVVLAHPDIDDQLVAGYDFIASADRARDGDGIDADANDPGDSDQKGESSWHGTHVAGTVAAASNNSTGGAGVTWGAKIMPIRVLGKGGGTSYDIIQGLRYAAGLPNDSNTLPARKADIANLSFGGSHTSRAEQEAYEAVRAAGVILVAAAGNNASSEALYPASYPEVISVSATDYANQLAPYSSYGPTVAIAAPGGNNAADLNNDGRGDGVLSTSVDDSKNTLDYVYRFYNGTSMAAPHVAGVLALMKSIYPALTPNDVDALINSGSLTDDLGTAGRDDIYGYGFINAVKAVSVAMDLAAGEALPDSQEPQVVATPADINLGFLSSASVTLTNIGGGTPQVVSFADDSEWLTVALETVDSNGLGSYALTVDRSGLTNGTYNADIVFSINDGSNVTVPVTMQVDTIFNSGELTQLYILLVDSETSEVTAQAESERESPGAATFSFSNVRPGNYYVVAGSDIDADKLICQVGEACGAYYNFSEPQILPVGEIDLTGIDFLVDIVHTFPASTTSVIVKPLQRQ